MGFYSTIKGTNHNFNHWFISTIQYLVFLRLYRASNLILTSGRNKERKNEKKERKAMKKGKYVLSNCIKSNFYIIKCKAYVYCQMYICSLCLCTLSASIFDSAYVLLCTCL